MTSDSTASLSAGATASACCASSTWIGPKKPDQTPTDSSEIHTTHRAGRRRVGSARAPVVTEPASVSRGRAGRRSVSAYQWNERFGVRTWVS